MLEKKEEHPHGTERPTPTHNLTRLREAVRSGLVQVRGSTVGSLPVLSQGCRDGVGNDGAYDDTLHSFILRWKHTTISIIICSCATETPSGWLTELNLFVTFGDAAGVPVEDFIRRLQLIPRAHALFRRCWMQYSSIVSSSCTKFIYLRSPPVAGPTGTHNNAGGSTSCFAFSEARAYRGVKVGGRETGQPTR